jgi:hypothetical protein
MIVASSRPVLRYSDNIDYIFLHNAIESLLVGPVHSNTIFKLPYEMGLTMCEQNTQFFPSRLLLRRDTSVTLLTKLRLQCSDSMNLNQSI